MVTYIITLILIPIILSFLPGPREKHTLHLEAKRVNALLKVIDHLVHHRRNAIYVIIAVLSAVSIVGMFNIRILGYVVDDLPQSDPVYEDLKFFEKHFHGVLPFEILIDTREEKGVTADQGTVLYKINRMQKLFAEYPEFSRPISLVEAVKFTNQAYNDGDSRKYILPGAADLNRLSDYSGTVTGKKGMLSSFIDSSMRYTRVTVQMADVGSARMKQIITELRPRVDSIFDPGKYTVEFTGHSLMFTKSNDYLLYNLLESLLIEIVLITIVGFALFRSIRIILLSKLPVLIPLVITAGIMGFLEISFRPSTILIFSIAFGISSDGTIYFLTRYKQELRNAGTSVSEAISITIRETGLSMVYTTIILFFGFAIFAASGFGGTVALGILLSITLLMAMVTNLVLLPSILLTIDKRRSRKELLQPALIEIEEDEAED
jgi:predicted RND superfamily exporter protein